MDISPCFRCEFRCNVDEFNQTSSLDMDQLIIKLLQRV